jgi:hypothetical protein
VCSLKSLITFFFHYAHNALFLAEKERLLKEKTDSELELLLQCDIDEDGTIELHEFFRVRSQQILAKRGVTVQKSGLNLNLDQVLEAEEEPKCAKCQKKLLPGAPFCTGCGTKSPRVARNPN